MSGCAGSFFLIYSIFTRENVIGPQCSVASCVLLIVVVSKMELVPWYDRVTAPCVVVIVSRIELAIVDEETMLCVLVSRAYGELDRPDHTGEDTPVAYRKMLI